MAFGQGGGRLSALCWIYPKFLRQSRFFFVLCLFNIIIEIWSLFAGWGFFFGSLVLTLLQAFTYTFSLTIIHIST